MSKAYASQFCLHLSRCTSVLKKHVIVSGQLVFVVPNGAQVPSMKLQQCMDVVYARHKDHLPFSQVRIVAYKRNSNIGNLLVRARH